MASRNLYHGVNAHLMSAVQAEYGDRAFYTVFLVKLMLMLNRYLPDHYRAKLDDSHCPPEHYSGNGKPALKRQRRFDEPVVAEPDLYIPVMEAEETSLAVVICETMTSRPVTRINVLSTRDKLLEEKRAEYRERRLQFIRSGLGLVEIDFMHETRPMLYALPRYPADSGATAYYVAVTDPRTSDKTAIYRFGVDQPIPTISVPLLYGVEMPCDMDKVYQETFEEGRFGDDVDYRQVPFRLNAYSPSDQQKIREVMARAR